MILAYFKTFLKKTKKIRKWHAKKKRKEKKRRPNFIENGILSPKNSKDESFGNLKLFKNRNLGNYLQNEVWENLFQNLKEMRK